MDATHEIIARASAPTRAFAETDMASNYARVRRKRRDHEIERDLAEAAVRALVATGAAAVIR